MKNLALMLAGALALTIVWPGAQAAAQDDNKDVVWVMTYSGGGG